MSEDGLSVSRRKRVNRIKIYLIIIFLVLLISPAIISIYVISELKSLNGRVDELDEKLAKLELSYLLKDEANNSLEQLEIEKDKIIEETKEAVLKETAKEEVEEETRKKVYLTFDDGPSMYTHEILEILDKYGVKATFFVTGYQAEKHKEWYKDIVDGGHAIGMHSFTHVYNDIYASKDSFSDDVEKIHDFIQEVTGVDSRIYRFPGGSSNHVSKVSMHELCELVHENNLEYYDWNISSQDANSPTPDKNTIVQNVLSGIDKNEDCIILMHDAAEKHATVEALQVIIEELQKREDIVILPITEDTEAIQHLDITLSGR